MTEQDLIEVLARINGQNPFETYAPNMQSQLQYINQSYPSLLDPMSQRSTPMPTRGTMDFIGGDTVMPFNPNMPIPEEKIFWGADNSKTLNLNAGGGTNESANARGYGFGGRVGTNFAIPETLTESELFTGVPQQDKYLLSLGLSGGGMRQRYGIGKPWEGVEEQSKIQAIDATLADLARNQEFMAQIKRDQNNVPFYSLAYRKRF